MLQKHGEEDPKESWREDTTLFDPAADVEGLRSVAVELHSALHVAVEGLNQALQLGWAANLGQDSQEALSADKVERLREIDESYVLFPALLLKLVKGEECLPLIFQLGRHVRQVSTDVSRCRRTERRLCPRC